MSENYNLKEEYYYETVDCETLEVNTALKPEQLYDNSQEISDYKWKCSNFIKEKTIIPIRQVLYALGEILNIRSTEKLIQFVEKQTELMSILRRDSIGRQYFVYKDYKQWALKNKKKLKLIGKRGKEVKLCILGL